MKIGWVRRTWENDFELETLKISTIKGKKKDWFEHDWPPLKLYILTEEEYKSIKNRYDIFRQNEIEFWKGMR